MGTRIYKKCFVRTCNNDTESAPNKIYLYVPRTRNIRFKWFKAANNESTVTKTQLYCCEDHFNLPIDCENWTKHQLTGCKIILKPDVVPHIFLQTDITSQLTDSAKKRQQLFKSQQNIPSAKKKLRFDDGEGFTSSIPVHKTESSTSMESTSSKGKSSDYLSETTSTDEVDQTDYIKELSKKRIFIIIENNSRFYLGLPQEIYFLVKLLCEEHVALQYLDVLLALKKIRLNDPFLRLSIDFGVSASYVQAAFRKAVPVMAAIMKQLIIWPSKETIIKLLPIAFRKRFSNVQSIIDCFEIEIEKPSNPQYQALTWSAYKSCNTIKYLISCTPHGVVNFISHGYGGRATDAVIVSDCGYLNILPTECAVLADRGFKNIAAELSKKKCYLVRPPSVIQGTGLTKDEVRMSKRVAAVRIHIERVISRIREFSMLTPHATIDKNLINLVDFVVVIACAVVNMQGTLIKH